MAISKKSGFTLIELSIVIVIIGLIVAGIVGGQKLVTQAKIRAVISEFNKYDAASSTFHLEYNAILGDMPNASAYSLGVNCSGAPYDCNGSGNDRIHWQDMNNGIAYDNHENFIAWTHLRFAGLIEGAYTGNNNTGGPNAMLAGLNIPASAFKSSRQGGWVFNSDDRWKNTIPVRNQLIIGGHVPNQRSYGSLFTPSQAKSIDNKMDDGRPYTGRVIGLAGYDGSAYDSNCTDGAGGDNEEYMISETIPRCIVALHLTLTKRNY
ncbi:MAG: prepilin-type N-terminal cleavage/methylation domain-containing protein [Rickettsiales bacterium]|nr:prepilin-type N-terminal cleavage/methylation domain-containing protein [Pseudomonadota bacterium]MDA0967593.1 prepilin-type N-terminal cleavage/methylation domain-containing protein [Pseudomonadota bacterium]MDG4544378.1 prepilin-type N-terminal cleavage/methylation domain-containing protein [Rickettsiales bacterium]MDG4546508.1 prepilin-type N-terminal cleavage/methylation domain-containing protein [Rickettsiales bacterium]MDG4548656.1 prepilin-type N-terminal cleavage/methylation domain-c